MDLTETPHVAVALDDPSAVAEVRRRGAALAQTAGFDAGAAGVLALALTEASTNIVKHAGRGTMLLRALSQGIEVFALDRGPGMANVAESMRDGHSTAGSPGTGLGSLARITSALDIWSQAGKGTVLRFEVRAKPRTAPAQPADPAMGVICVAKPHETVCGDAWTILRDGRRIVALVVDGLGHGPDAALAARTAVAAAHNAGTFDPTALMEAVHGALRPTRGAAAGAALIDPGRELCVFCGIGNISASLRTGGKTRSMVSHNGILGHHVRKTQAFEYPFANGSLLVAHSDGLTAHWDLAAYTGLESRAPALIAAVLYRDHARGRDDATVVVLRPAT